MNKYLPRELRDLKDSKVRVMQNVEHSIRGKRNYTMPKIIVSFIALSAIVFISLFTYKQLTLKEVERPTDESIPIILEEGQYDEMLRGYFAENQSEKLMYDTVNGNFKVETTWLSKQYVKEVTKYETKSHSLVQYYRIANNKIEIVKTENNEGSYSIEALNKMAAETVLVEAPFRVGQSSSGWVVKKADSRWGMFKHVVVLERNDNGYITTMTLVPKFGLVNIVGSKDGEVAIETSFLQLNLANYGEDVRFEKFTDTNVELPKDTSWKISHSHKYRMTVLGAGEFETVGTIIIEEMAYNYQTAFTIANVEYGQITPKDVAWIDDHRIFVIIGMTHGTVTRGGKLYILDIVNNSLTPLIDNLPERSEISGITSGEIDGESFRYELFTYLTEDYVENESEITEGLITIQGGIVESINGDEITYSRWKLPGGTVKVEFQRNNDLRAIDFEDVKVGDLIEFIIVDGVAVHLNKIA